MVKVNPDKTIRSPFQNYLWYPCADNHATKNPIVRASEEAYIRGWVAAAPKDTICLLGTGWFHLVANLKDAYAFLLEREHVDPKNDYRIIPLTFGCGFVGICEYSSPVSDHKPAIATASAYWPGIILTKEEVEKELGMSAKELLTGQPPGRPSDEEMEILSLKQLVKELKSQLAERECAANDLVRRHAETTLALRRASNDIRDHLSEII